HSIADVTLALVGKDQTELVYQATISAEGTLNTLLPLIENAATQRVEDFFTRFIAALDSEDRQSIPIQK
ncbi:MAG: hypothetical protein GY696_38215, partial [Gammaproteobacteria bacterium]|nr:hypothetical protein [Gammaproteobacteria bacterium]